MLYFLGPGSGEKWWPVCRDARGLSRPEWPWFDLLYTWVGYHFYF